MKIGKVIISEFVIIIICFVCLMAIFAIGGTVENIEKEHTKQIELQTQTQIQNKEMENENYGNN